MNYQDIRSAIEQYILTLIEEDGSCLPPKECWILQNMKRKCKADLDAQTHAKLTHLPQEDIQRNSCQFSRLGIWQIQLFLKREDCICEKRDGYDGDKIIDCLICAVRKKSSLIYERDGAEHCLNLFHAANGRAQSSRLPRAYPLIEGDLHDILTIDIPYQVSICSCDGQDIAA